MELKKYLEDNEITPAEFARAISASVATVSRLINGKVLPSRETMAKVRKATSGKVTADDFYENAQ